MRTARARQMIGENVVTVTHTKRGDVLIHETDFEGETTRTSEVAFRALERRVQMIRSMIETVVRKGREP